MSRLADRLNLDLLEDTCIVPRLGEPVLAVKMIQASVSDSGNLLDKLLPFIVS